MRIVAQIIGVMMVLAGLVLTLSPVPFSTLLMVLGIALLIVNNHWVAQLVRSLRRRSPLIERLFQLLRHIVPRTWRDDIDDSDLDEFSRRNNRRDDG